MGNNNLQIMMGNDIFRDEKDPSEMTHADCIKANEEGLQYINATIFYNNRAAEHRMYNLKYVKYDDETM